MYFFKERNLPESVKILIPSTGKWEEALVLDEINQEKCIVRYKRKEMVLNTNMVRPFKKLQYVGGRCEDVENFCKQNWNNLKHFVTLGYSHILKHKDNLLSFDDEEKTIYYKDSWISIAPGVLERSTILGFIERPCWEISISVMTSGSWDEPDDVDVVPYGSQENTVSAAQMFIELIWKEENRGFWDNLDLEGDQYD